MSQTINTLKAVLASFAAGLVLMASAAQAETVVSVTQYSYDYMNRPVCSALRMNTANFGSLPGDACTLGTQGTDGPDRISKTTYSASGKPTQIDQAYGVAGTQRAYVRYTYNNHGLKETERDANGNTTTYEYDGFDRLVKVRYPVTTANTFSSSTSDYETFGYDANGNRISWRRRDGNTILYTFDNLNRQIVKDMPGGTAQDVYTNYDGLGHITAKRFVSTSGAGVTYAYDGLGRVSSTTDMNSRTVAYNYNADSTRSLMTFPDSQGQYYYYQNTGALNWTGIGGGSVGVQPYYDSLGHLTALGRNNGAHTYYGYDPVGRLASMSHDFAGTGYDITWTFSDRNPVGQITKWGATSTVFDYKETAGATVNKTFDGLNRDAGIAALSGGYDAKGNMTFDGARTFTYDLENRLLSESAAGVALSLEYDTEGRLSKYTSSGSVTTFLYDGVNLIAEYDGSGAMTKRYMHTLGTDQPWVQFNGSGLTSGNAQYLYANYQGSIIALADSSGTVTDMFKYGPYGEPKNSVNFESWTGSRFRYTGQIMLPDARLYYYKARVYDPIAGRFLQTDPVGGEDDLDLYAYVGGDPVNASDPTGTFVCLDCSTGMAGDGWVGVGDIYGDGGTGSVVYVGSKSKGKSATPDIGQPEPGGTIYLDERGRQLTQSEALTQCATGSKCAPKKHYLKRPYVGKSTRAEVWRRAPRDRSGGVVDPNTRQPIKKPVLGHKYGIEFWRMRDQAEAAGWTQQQFNEYAQNPDLYQIEEHRENASHFWEMPRN